MKSKTQKYFESMLNKTFFGEIPNLLETNQTHSHRMSIEELEYQFEVFEERIYLENEAFSHFCDFLNKE